jgi:glycerol-1-phosphate dehydrogenase [NAD(P)+]
MNLHRWSALSIELSIDLDPFDIRYADLCEVAREFASTAVFAVNDPPWSSLSEEIPGVLQVIHATSMEEADLEALAARVSDRATIAIGIGGGTAIDTAKYIGWTRGIPMLFMPTIASVDATFTDAVGIRRDRRVVYVGKVRPQEVILDLPRIAAAPNRLNRAGIGDILSCHTGLFDWRFATDHHEGPAWNNELGALGASLLDDLEAAAPQINVGDVNGIDFLMQAYRRIGAACAAAGHSRFEEGSEHFFGYALEEDTGRHFVHGELISMCVVAMSTVQGNDPDRAIRIIEQAGTLAHPDAVGIDEVTFRTNLARLASYARQENLDFSWISDHPVTNELADAAWEAVCALPGKGQTP